MNTITYSLKDNRPDSEDYYARVAVFTDSVLSEAKKRFQSVVDLYKKNKGKNLWDEECYLELLIMGTFWKTYGMRASGLGKILCRILGYFEVLREKQGIYTVGGGYL